MTINDFIDYYLALHKESFVLEKNETENYSVVIFSCKDFVREHFYVEKSCLIDSFYLKDLEIEKVIFNSSVHLYLVKTKDIGNVVLDEL